MKNETYEQLQWTLGMAMTIERIIQSGDKITKKDILDMENGAEGMLIALRKARESEYPE